MIVKSQSELIPIEKIYLKSLGESVYNFTTETHTYCLADGAVVHNCDTISMLSCLNTWKPSAETTLVQDSDDMWELEDLEEDYTSLDNYIV